MGDIDYDRKLMTIHGSKTDSADRIVPPIPPCGSFSLGSRKKGQMSSKLTAR